MLELGEVRQIIEPAAARMAATRRTGEHIALLSAALEAMRQCAPDQFDELVRADLEFHRTLLLAAGNELLQHFEVILEPALQARDALLHDRGSDRSFVDSHASVLEAIAAGNADSAFERMSRLMVTAASDAETALARDPRGRTVLNQRAPAQRADPAHANPLPPNGASVI
ncbi:MAG: FCD domain-containing protein [Salinibacterium sp.]|nr:FCD domain-containing protein [Salinibacterium sp.]